LIAKDLRLSEEKEDEQALHNFSLAAKILPGPFIAYKLAGETACNIGNLYNKQELLKEALKIQPNGTYTTNIIG